MSFIEIRFGTSIRFYLHVTLPRKIFIHRSSFSWMKGFKMSITERKFLTEPSKMEEPTNNFLMFKTAISYFDTEL